MTRPSKPAAIAFGVASGLLIAIKLLFEFYPGDFPVKGQAAAFTWPIVLGIILLAVIGLTAERSLATGSQFPEPLSDRQRERRAAVIAIVTGFSYGIVTVVQDLGSPGSGNPLNVAEWPHVPWPWSVPFYAFGAILLEFMLRLGALCILVWLIHVVILRRRWLLPAFWIVNLIVATYEILPSVMEDVAAGKWRDGRCLHSSRFTGRTCSRAGCCFDSAGCRRSSSGSPSTLSGTSFTAVLGRFRSETYA